MPVDVPFQRPNTSRHEDVIAAVRVDEIRHVGLLPVKEGGKCPHLLLVIEILHLHLMIENLIIGENASAHLILGQTITSHEVEYSPSLRLRLRDGEVFFVEDDALFRFRFHSVSFRQGAGKDLPSPVSMHISNGCRCFRHLRISIVLFRGILFRSVSIKPIPAVFHMVRFAVNGNRFRVDIAFCKLFFQSFKEDRIKAHP